MNPSIRHLESDADILLAWPVVHALRPHLVHSEYLAQVREQEKQGYRMIGLVLPSEGMTGLAEPSEGMTGLAEPSEVIASFSGFRAMHKLSGGRGIYIDDLSTLPEHRGKGYGGMLLDYIHDLARREGMENVQLDSGHHRHPAHRLYLNKGYAITAHHFTIPLGSGTL
jgi:GNAT superfamily N-acetyltransferase